MNAPAAIRPANLWRRASARAIDAFLSVFLAALLATGAGCTAAVVAQPDLFSEENWESYYMLLALLLVPASILVVRYEVAATSRRGQTLGKRCMGIRVLDCGDQHGSPGDWEHPDLLYSLVRWVIPHGVGVLAAVLAGVVAIPRIGGSGWLVCACVGLAAWTTVYLSSLLDENGRGWHDKAAGTVALEAQRLPQERAPQGPPP